MELFLGFLLRRHWTYSKKDGPSLGLWEEQFRRTIQYRRSSCRNTGSIRHGPYWTARESSLKLIELFSIKRVHLVQVFTCKNTESMALFLKDGPSLDI